MADLNESYKTSEALTETLNISESVSISKNDFSVGVSGASLSAVVPEEKSTRYQVCKVLEWVIVASSIVITWSLLSLPIIFYSLDSRDGFTNNQLDANSSNASLQCMNSFNIDTTNAQCQGELLRALSDSNCNHDLGENVMVTRDMGELANQFLSGLQAFGASSACLAEATSFVCLYAYGLCSSSGVYLQPTLGECEQLRDSLCQREWEAAISLGIDLPNCDQFPIVQATCAQSDNTTANITMSSEKVNNEANTQNSPMPTASLVCSDGFYQENGSQVCIPSCGDFKQADVTTVIVIDVLICLIAILGLIAGVVILIISCLDPKRMLQFPSIFVVYLVVDCLVLEFLILVTYTDRSGLYCSSRNLLESLQKVTPYCVITGILFNYILLQLAMWWVLQTSVIFWKIVFPFHANSFKTKLKYVHAICFVLGLLLPLTPVIASMSKFAVDSRNAASNGTSASQLFLDGGLGFTNTRYPPIVCSSSNTDVIFYSLILPLNIIQIIGTTLIIFMIWKIRKVTLGKARRLSSPFVFGTPEKKLLVIFLYFEILSTFALITFTLNIRYSDEFFQSVLEFFACEQGGYNADKPCSRADISRYHFPSLSAISFIIFGSFPIVNLVYALNVQAIKKCFSKMKRDNKKSIKSSSVAFNQKTETVLSTQL